jgi:hypothetical protein
MFVLVSKICPFQVWMQQLAVTIELTLPQDGNVRMASLIGAIPLIYQGIPPAFMPKSLRKEYNEVMQKVRPPLHATYFTQLTVYA